MLTVKSREGAEMKVRMTDNVAVIGIAKTSLSEIKPGSYIGVSAMPGRTAARRRRGSYLPGSPARHRRRFQGLGSAAQQHHDQRHGGETVAGTDGQNIRVKYKDGEKKVVVAAGNADRHIRLG